MLEVFGIGTARLRLAGAARHRQTPPTFEGDDFRNELIRAA